MNADDLEKRVTQAVLDRWADLSGDHNPLHNDPAYARTTRYGGTILHGHLSLTWLTEWAMREWGAEWLQHGNLADLRFRAPLRPDVRYLVRAEPTDDSGARSLSILLPDGRAGVTATARLLPPRKEDR
jgi:acyl dehydratase